MQYGELIARLLNVTWYLTQQTNLGCNNATSGVNVTELSEFCVTNRDCATDEVCADFRCVNPCLEQCQECSKHDQCPENKGCINGDCEDPCPGVCGDNANCRVSNHYPTCTCVEGFSGDGFKGCHKTQKVFYPQTDKQLNWYEALADCAAQGLRLATLDNEAEFQQLRELIIQAFAQENKPRASVWLSGSDLGKNGHFVWMSTGRPVTFTKWEINEPSGGKFNGVAIQSCMQLWADRNYNMDNYGCLAEQYYCCESVAG